METSLVEQVRIFNRFYTREIGLLTEHLHGSDFTLAEARVLYELAQSREQTAADIIRSLGTDKAHISRIVARFQNAGLVKSRVSPEHGKHKLLSLTATGKRAFKQLNDGTESQIEALIAPLIPANRQRLARDMHEIQKLLVAKTTPPEAVQLRSLKVGDLGWITHRQAVLYEQEYGWDWTYEGLVAQILGDFATHFDATHEDAWVADLSGEVVGSVFLMKSSDAQIAKLRLLYVDPAARGLGVGSRLVRRCIERARELGYSELTLWTNDILVSARKIYQSAGFTLLDENRHHSFGKDLIGQTWVLDLDHR
jgi:DNA-binding MarR family transcriptional regulator/N-acetylglutamate synthase-like GNAT family acetyltransferase